MSNKIVPNLWFNQNAQEAVDYYVSVFPKSKVLSIAHYPETSEQGLADFQAELAGQPLTIEFELNGQHFTAINAGPEFKFSEAISFAVYCQDQDEIDYYWSKLSADPESEQCGWCKDAYGLSWQIVPKNMDDLMKKPGAFKTMMQQKKIIIADY